MQEQAALQTVAVGQRPDANGKFDADDLHFAGECHAIGDESEEEDEDVEDGLADDTGRFAPADHFATVLVKGLDRVRLVLIGAYNGGAKWCG